MVTLTDKALQAVTRFIDSSEKSIAGLRIMVEGGGCSGFQYKLKLEEQVSADDVVTNLDGLTLLVDAASSELLEGVTVDFVDSMEGSGFKFENPNAKASCGCGKSFAA